MVDPIKYLYLGIVYTIRLIKWCELQVLHAIKPWLRKKAIEIMESIGIVYHFPNENKACLERPVLSKAEEERISNKCKYDKLCHVKVFDTDYFVKLANKGTLASGEAFMDQIFETYDESDYVEYGKRVLENDIFNLYWNPWNRLLDWLQYCAFNLQTKERAFIVGEEHYDLGNDLYTGMLDPWMQYTCAYWARADNLNDAQVDKMELIAKKLDLKPGMKVLDIGCGWGTLCKYLAEKHAVECVGITVGKEGVEYGKRVNKGLKVDIRLQDYRDLDEKFDRIVSIGCLEHIGEKNYREFFEVANRCLNDDGVFLCHTIGRNHKNLPRTEGWLDKYIFANGQLPNIGDMDKATRGLFIVEDWHNFGKDYARTLREWRGRFLGSWEEIGEKYGERFKRMWVYYLYVCEAMFLSRRLQLWQLVLSKDGLQREYRAAR